MQLRYKRLSNVALTIMRKFNDMKLRKLTIFILTNIRYIRLFDLVTIMSTINTWI